MQRYFGRILNNDILLEDDDIFHLTKVMRARKGEEIEVVADDKVYLCEVTSLKPIRIVAKRLIKEDNELPNYIILVAALLKGDKMDYVLQKATELGVSEIVLLTSERTIVKVKNQQRDLKLGRYQKILKEAAEQSKRLRIPHINSIISFDRIDEIDANVRFIAYEGLKNSVNAFNKRLDNIKPKQRVAVIIGPEGGFSLGEVEYAKNNGFVPVGLGSRILRAETASIYALSVIANRLEAKKNNA